MSDRSKKRLALKNPSRASFEKEWKRRTKHICKPCWELKYCPYGPLVEQFPLHEKALKKAIELGYYSKLVKGKGWIPCDKDDIGAYPDISRIIEEFGNIDEHSCEIFGHDCPVFSVNEPFTESNELRRIGRSIPRETFLRVVRRDNQTCQVCGRVLKDREIVIDHVIPFSKGGPTQEENLRVLCEDCNRKKGASIHQ